MSKSQKINLDSSHYAKKSKTSLKQSLTTAIGATLHGPNGIDIKNFLKNMRSVQERIISTKADHISASQVSLEIYGRLLKIEAFARKPESVFTLKASAGDEAIETVAGELAEFFSGIPRPYQLLVELPGLANKDCMNQGLTKSIGAIECFGNVVDQEESREGNWLSLAFAQRKSPPDPTLAKQRGVPPGLYLNLEIHGYADDSFDNNTVLSGLGRIKELIYLLNIENKLDLQSEVGNNSGLRAKVYLRDKNLKDGILTQIRIPESLAAFLGRIMLKKDWATEVENSRVAYADPKKPTALLLTPPEPKPFLFLTEKQTKIIDASRANTDLIAIKNSLAWGFDSESTQYDGTMSFIQLAIALEAILGIDSDRASKTNQLADRCALLIGNSRGKRVELRRSFVEFYNARSSLVHGSLTHLDHSLDYHRHWGQWALHSILRREIMFLTMG